MSYKEWIVSFLFFLFGALISNLYWLAVTVNGIVFIPAVTLSIVAIAILGVQLEIVLTRKD